MQISELNKEQKEDIQKYYGEQHKECTDMLIDMVAQHVKNQDRIGLLHLMESCSVILKTAVEALPDQDIDEGFPTIGGVQ